MQRRSVRKRESHGRQAHSLFSVLSRVHAHVHLGRITMFVAETKHHGDIVVVIVRLMTGNMFHQPATLDLRNLGMLGAMEKRND